MATFEILLALLAFCVALNVLARRLRLPTAVLLVLGGMGLALIPGLPPVKLDPDLALALFLPPLLQVSAYRTDWPAFRSSLRPILLLAVGAVFFSAAAVAVVAHLILPSLPWWAAIALGAIVAPPDAVAASAVLKQFRLPKRIVVVLEGESLINDASSLVLYRFAVAAVAVGTVSYSDGILRLFGMAVGGAVVGWLVGHVAMWVFAKIDDTLLDIAVSILAGFVAYLGAEALHASGVLGAVACGWVLGRKQHTEFTARTRLELNAVWNSLEFVLGSLVFMLIGLQLRGTLQRLASTRTGELVLLGVAVSLMLILSRFIWVFGTAWLPRMASRRLLEADPMPPLAQLTILSWAGMRGVVSLAAALALPGKFPGRDLIVFLALCAIFATLILQGTTLGWLIDRLKVVEPETATAPPELSQARSDIADAARDAVKAHLEADEPTEHRAAAGELVGEYEKRAERASTEGRDAQETQEQRAARQQLRLVAIEASRTKLAEHADRVELDAHRTLVAELDLEEQRVRSAVEDKPA